MAFATRSSSSMLTVLIQVMTRSSRNAGTLAKIHARKNSGRMGVHPAASAWGASGGDQCVSRSGSDVVIVGTLIAAARNRGNNAKELGVRKFGNPFAFSALIGFARRENL